MCIAITPIIIGHVFSHDYCKYYLWRQARHTLKTLNDASLHKLHPHIQKTETLCIESVTVPLTLILMMSWFGLWFIFRNVLWSKLTETAHIPLTKQNINILVASNNSILEEYYFPASGIEYHYWLTVITGVWLNGSEFCCLVPTRWWPMHFAYSPNGIWHLPRNIISEWS